SKIHKALNKDIQLKELFRLPTIKELSEFIENEKESIYSKIERVKEKEKYEASSAQKRMYMLQQFDNKSIAYNMPVVFGLDGNVDKKQIEATFKKLIERHEALRTYFETDDDQIVQRVDNSYEFKLEVRPESGDIDTIINNFIRPFDLSEAPLIRVNLVENEEKTYLLIDMHHIISDRISASILVNEFKMIYNGKKLEPLKLQYKDFSEWQNKFLQSEEMKKQEEYWLNMFKDEIPVLNMPTDYERLPIRSFEGNNVSFEVDEDTTEQLKKLTKETGTTMHMVLLSAFNILLSKYSGQEDIVIGVPIAGRPHADVQNIMGMFVNTLALRNKPEGNKRYLDFLKEVKENSLSAYENQDYSLEVLVEKLNIVRDTSRNPLFDVMFDMVGTVSSSDIEVEELVLKSYNMEGKVSKFELSLDAIERPKTLKIMLSYCVEFFHKETVEIMLEDYYLILKTISIDKNVALNNIELKYLTYDSELNLSELEEFSL
ncbi:condensation domain-containing protein, partial [Lysinibacillus xylanilyticus]|uniref:condensation domain-containing protein n=1 Tax=Lysinibacillus xylanilyticus TaxID=582475 RepID=UPI003803F234